MMSVLLGLLILPSTVTTTNQLSVLWISAISSFCTSRYVAGDDVTRGRPGAKYVWLMYNTERNKFISSKETDVIAVVFHL